MIVTANGSTGPAQEVSKQSMVSPLLQLLRRCNSFFIQNGRSIQGECRSLVVCGYQVGIIRPDMACCLLSYPHVFTATPNAFILNAKLDSYEARSSAIDKVMRDLRSKSAVPGLRGWRDECFDVYKDFGTEPLFRVERSAAAPLGIRTFGVHVMGYSYTPAGGVVVWIQKRAADKPTYPGMQDTMVGGGVTAGLLPSEVVIKESAEEASIPEEMARTIRPVGVVSFLPETERGIHANALYVYEVELPYDFKPTNSDGEVEGFEAVPINELLDRVLSSKYKLTSAPVAIDFLIRHGFISQDTHPDLASIQELLHVPLSQLYNSWWPFNYRNDFSTSETISPSTDV